MKNAIKLAIVIAAMFAGSAQAVHYLQAKYGEAFTLYFSIYDSNYPHAFYQAAPAADDVSIRKDGGTRARATNAVTDLDHIMSLALTPTEMTAACVTVDVNDETSPKLYGDDSWIIYTFGNASATNTFDLDSATVTPGANSITASVIATDAITSDEIAASGLAEIVDGVWDESMSAHKVKQTSGWWIQRGGGADPIQITGTAQAGGTSNTIKLAADSSATNNAYTPCTITLVTGTGAPAIRTGLSYNGTTKVMTIAGTWPGSTPAADTTYLIQAAPTSYFSAAGLAQSAGSNTLVTASGDVRADNLTGLLWISSGTGSGTDIYPVRDSYDANDTLVISGAWANGTPDGTSYYTFLPSGTLVDDTTVPTPTIDLQAIYDTVESAVGSIDVTVDAGDLLDIPISQNLVSPGTLGWVWWFTKADMP